MARYTLFVLVGTTGAGKSTLSKLLAERVPHLKRIRSCTTRARREGESEDAYHWLTREEFIHQLESGHFVEHDEFGGQLYGRRFQDFQPLDEGPCFADMTEKGMLALQERPYQFKTVCLRVVPANKPEFEREAERAADDAARLRIPIRVDHEVRNDHKAPDGLERAFAEIREIIDMHVHPEG